MKRSAAPIESADPPPSGPAPAPAPGEPKPGGHRGSDPETDNGAPGAGRAGDAAARRPAEPSEIDRSTDA